VVIQAICKYEVSVEIFGFGQSSQPSYYPQSCQQLLHLNRSPANALARRSHLLELRHTLHQAHLQIKLSLQESLQMLQTLLSRGRPVTRQSPRNRQNLCEIVLLHRVQARYLLQPFAGTIPVGLSRRRGDVGPVRLAYLQLRRSADGVVREVRRFCGLTACSTLPAALYLATSASWALEGVRVGRVLWVCGFGLRDCRRFLHFGFARLL
jgi:hypothetical protein